MDTEIVLEREGASGVLKLDDDEAALLQEVTIEHGPAVRKPMRKQKPPKGRSRQRPVEEDDMVDAFMNPTKSSAPPRPPPEEFDYGNGADDVESDSDMDMGGGYSGGGGGGYSGEQPSDGYASIDDEKADLLNKLTRLEKKGFNVNKKLNAYSAVSDLRTEVKRITYTIEVDQAVKFSRRALVACVTGLEFLNKRYNPLEIQLEGWSESIMENVEDYDGVFEELHNKYKGKMEMAPEVKMIMMLGGSATMFHLTNSMFKAAMPNMNDVIKQNPDLVKNMMSAVQNTTPRGAPPPSPDTNTDGRREMQGPGMDISSLMNGIMMPPPPPMSSAPIAPPVGDDAESVSDIVSMTSGADSDTRDINVTGGKRRGRPKGSSSKNKDKKEISL
jgi:hypothetical protein